MAYDEDYESEYSEEDDEGEPVKADMKKGSAQAKQSSEDEESEEES